MKITYKGNRVIICLPDCITGSRARRCKHVVNDRFRVLVRQIPVNCVLV